MKAWALLLALALPARAYAGEEPATGLAPKLTIGAPTVGEGADPTATVVMMEGDKAPFQGLLVPELRFTELLKAETDVADLKGQLNIEQEYSKQLGEMYQKRLDEAAKPPPWYDSPNFRTGVGVTIGVLITIGTLLVSAKIVKVAEDGNR